MKKRKLLILLITIPLILLLTSACGCEEEQTKEDLEFQKQVDEMWGNTALDNTNTVNGNVNAQMDLGPPKITDIEYDQLHAYYGDLPHRYTLTAKGTYLDFPLDDKLSYGWSVDCGYFWQDGKNMGQTLQNGQSVEWRYDTAGECINAKATVQAADPEDFEESESFTKKLFEG